MSEQEHRMTKKELLDSIPVGPRGTDGKDPMRDLHVGGPRRRPDPRVAEEHERRLLSMFKVWMAHPTAKNPLERLADLMLAHEIRAYTAKVEAKSQHAAQAAQQ